MSSPIEKKLFSIPVKDNTLKDSEEVSKYMEWDNKLLKDIFFPEIVWPSSLRESVNKPR